MVIGIFGLYRINSTLKSQILLPQDSQGVRNGDFLKRRKFKTDLV